jgi:hypothetical protein
VNAIGGHADGVEREVELEAEAAREVRKVGARHEAEAVEGREVLAAIATVNPPRPRLPVRKDRCLRAVRIDSASAGLREL